MSLPDMNPTTRFSDRADDYVKYRPSYPDSTIDAILSGLPPRITIADIGAGTGIASRLLASRGHKVLAIEPNAQMRAAAAPHLGITFLDATAESTQLLDASVHLVTCFQAFHWIRQDRALREFARILSPNQGPASNGGRIAIVWNERDFSDPVMTLYRDSIRAAGGEHPAELRAFDPAVIPRSGLFSEPTLHEAPNSQRLDEQGLIGRVMSASYAPKTGPRADQLRADLQLLYARHKDKDGLITLRYITRAWSAQLR